MPHLMHRKKIGNRNGLRLEQDSCWYSREVYGGSKKGHYQRNMT